MYRHEIVLVTLRQHTTFSNPVLSGVRINSPECAKAVHAVRSKMRLAPLPYRQTLVPWLGSSSVAMVAMVAMVAIVAVDEMVEPPPAPVGEKSFCSKAQPLGCDGTSHVAWMNIIANC